MQVADRTDHITHAVLGGQQATSFGISDDPAFFQILSSSLYKDPVLAMVRETLCNAWDAHIDAGITDRPLLITLDNEHLTIRDFGKGIPADMIVSVYGVYGASTKKNDGRQTGGFGLGCKSPFAYTDHFEVISMNGGTKTIYRMSKSSAERMGKPSITPIVSFPTTETGISVKIPLKSGDSGRISTLVHKVVFNGDIFATLNGRALDVLGLTDAPAGFVLINRQQRCPVDTFSLGSLFIRYGNVIYPVEHHEKITSSMNIATNFLDKFFQCDLVMLAPPDSLSITPSRESLNMSDMTTETIKKLLADFLAYVMKSREIQSRHEEIVYEAMEAHATADTSVRAKLASLDQKYIPGVQDIEGKLLLKTVDDFAIMQTLVKYTHSNRNLDKKKWGEFIKFYLNKLVATGAIDRSKVQTWMRVYGIYIKDRYHEDGYRSWGEQNSDTSRALFSWFYRQVTKPVLKELRLHIPNFKDQDLKCYFRVGGIYHDRKVTDIQQAGVCRIIESTRLFLKPTLVITYNSNTILHRIREMVGNLNMEGFGSTGNYFILEVRRGKDAEEVTDAFIQKLQGIEVVDMRPRTPSEERAYQDQKANQMAIRAQRIAAGKPEKVPRKKGDGMIIFSELIDPEKKGMIDSTLFISLEDPVRTTAPACVLQISASKEYQRTLKQFDAQTSFLIAKLWGSEIGVTNNTAIYDKKRKDGILAINDFIFKKIEEEFRTSTTIREYMRFSPEKIENYLIVESNDFRKRSFATEMYKLLVNCDAVAHLIPGYTPLSETDQLRMTLWKGVREHYSLSQSSQVQTLRAEFGDIPLADEAKDVAKKLLESSLWGVIDVEMLTQQIAKHSSDPVKTAQFVSLVQTML